MNACVIGIDVGTSGVRVAALAADGAIVGDSAIDMASLGDPREPEIWWRGVTAAFAQLCQVCDIGGVKGVAADGTSGTMLAVDAEGRPVGPARLYDEPCDDEGVLNAIDTHAPADTAARGRTSALARVLLMQRRSGVRRLLHQADWISGRLSGRFDQSDANNALKTGYDPVAARWPDWIGDTGADVSKLPIVVAPGAPVASVGPEGIALGLPASAVVHAGTTDGCAAFLATGASEIGDGVTSLGSTLVIKLLCDQPISAPQYGIYSHKIGSMWLAGGASNSGGKVIERLFGRDRLEALSSALKPQQPTSLHYYPLTIPGERFPINDPKHPPRLEPRPADESVFFQGVLEGIAEVETLAYRKLRELGAPKLRSIRTVGGGAKNEGWSEIRQRVLRTPFAPVRSQEACVGVAQLVLRQVKA
jgi:sugar (pentulose or hexulose) kinase